MLDLDMETLVVAAQHGNQSYGRNGSQITERFGSSPSGGFKGINCRTFQSGSGIPPSSPSIFSPFANSREPRSPQIHSEPSKLRKRSNPIPITPKPSIRGAKEAIFSDELSSTELWAGPAYSNSPPPSSLPMPKFSLRQKRSVSLELPIAKSGIVFPPVVKSAPSSPTRELSLPAPDFFESTASATETLRRILHLDD